MCANLLARISPPSLHEHPSTAGSWALKPWPDLTAHDLLAGWIQSVCCRRSVCDYVSSFSFLFFFNHKLPLNLPHAVPALGYCGRRNEGPPLLRTQSCQRLSLFKPGAGQNNMWRLCSIRLLPGIMSLEFLPWLWSFRIIYWTLATIWLTDELSQSTPA